MSLRKGMLVGVRFSLDLGAKYEEVIRGGLGYTMVVDLPPISGPIYLHWSPLQKEGTRFWARCDRCGDTSKRYKRNGSHIKNWAHAHRCDTIYDER